MLISEKVHYNDKYSNALVRKKIILISEFYVWINITHDKDESRRRRSLIPNLFIDINTNYFINTNYNNYTTIKPIETKLIQGFQRGNTWSLQ